MIYNWVGIDYKHDKFFFIDRPNGSGDFLLLFFKTKTVIKLAEETVTANENSVIVFSRGYKQHYYTAEETLINDFIHFDTDDKLAEELFANIPFNCPIPMSNPYEIHTFFSLMNAEYHSENIYKTDNMEMIFQLLVNKMEEQSQISVNCGNSNTAALPLLRKEIYQNIQYAWSVPVMAEKCHYSISYLQVAYKKMFGVSCMNDVTNARCMQAKQLLKNTTYHIEKISCFCGYANPEHFMRQFKQRTGLTPTQYREKESAPR